MFCPYHAYCQLEGSTQLDNECADGLSSCVSPVFHPFMSSAYTLLLAGNPPDAVFL